MKALAGSRFGTPIPAGMSPYLVMFETAAVGAPSRQDRTIAQVERAGAIRKQLESFIDATGLAEQVASVAEGTVFGAVGVIATPAAAERLSRMDGVRRVLKSG